MNDAPMILKDGLAPPFPMPTDDAQAYRNLRQAMLDAHLLDRAIGYYARKCAVAMAISVLGGGIAIWFSSGFAAVVGGIVLGVGLVQVALIGHDAGHLAVFRKPGRNHILGLACWSLVAGIGFWYWCDRHNRHHAHTNDVEDDPDLGWTALIAYDVHQAIARRGLLRAITPYQAFVAAAFVPFVALAFRVESWAFTLTQLRGTRKIVEVALLGANLVVWAIVIAGQGPRGAVLFVVTQSVASAYLSFIIAPNHKGMPIWSHGMRLSFVQRQVLSSRNLTPGFFWDFVFGGLNYQIEHHLFPQMPRAHFQRAGVIVAAFCAEQRLPREVAHPFRAFADIFIRAHQIGQAAKKPNQPDVDCENSTR